MDIRKNETARFYLNRAVMDDAYALHADHPWFWEGARWRELIFSICVRVSRIEEADVRSMIEELDDLGLLEVQDLAGLPRNGAGMADAGIPLYRALGETMIRFGLDDREILRAVTAFADAACALSDGYQGKVQRYLRHYGELMIAELDQNFRFVDLGETEVRDAFTEWFQNCLAMPLSLRDRDMQKFCEDRGIAVQDLIQVAEASDINLAYLDDITQAAIQSMLAPEDDVARRSEAGE